MRGGIRAAALLAAMLLFGAACTLPNGTSQTAQGTPSQETTPSQQASPSGNATSTPAGTTETPSSQATPPSSAPAGTPPSKLFILNFSMHEGEIALGYTPVTVSGAGGTLPYHWSIGGGALPGGLSISSGGGTISGTPTASGSFSFVVLLQDSGGQAAGVSRSVTVITALTATAPCATQCTIGQGCSACGGFGNASGGLPPYTYSKAAGSVPSGMSWTGLGLSGPFPQGVYTLTVVVRDQLGAQVSVKANWSIYAPATLTAGGSCVDHVTGACTATGWTYAGGNPTVAPTVVITGYAPFCPINTAGCLPTPSSPPPGWSATAKGGVVSISAGPIQCNSPGYVGVLTLALVDPSSCATTLQSNGADLTVDISNGC